MVLIAPILLLISIAIATQILGRERLNIAQSWIFSVTGAVITWIVYLMAVFFLDGGNTAGSITPDAGTSFRLTPANSVIGLLLLTLLISVLLRDANKLTRKDNLLAWSGALVIAAVGMSVVFSNTLVVFLITSTVLDIGLFIAQILSHKEANEFNKSIGDFSLRLIGTVLIMLGEGIGFEANVFLTILGFLCRLGILSIGDEPSQSSILRRNLSAFFDLVVPLSAFAFISQNTPADSIFRGRILLLAILVLIIFSKLLKIIRNPQNRSGFKPWADVFSGIVILLYLTNNSGTIVPLAVVVAAWGGLFMLEEYGRKWLRIAIIVLMAGMIGIPFTPSYGIWVGASLGGSLFLGIFLNFTLILLAVLLFGKIFTTGDKNASQDRWIDVALGTSPIFLLISPWIVELWQPFAKGDVANYWGPGILLICLTGLLVVLRSRSTKAYLFLAQELKKIVAGRVFTSIEAFFSFSWVIKICSFVNRIIATLLRLFVRILEGDGGLLWAFVFLILLSSILVTYRLIS